MRRLLSLAVLAIFVLSILPTIPLVHATISTPQYVDTMSSGLNYKIAVSSQAHTAIIVWLNETGDHLFYMINSTSSLTTVTPKTLLPEMYGVGEFAVATNGTDYVIVVANNTGTQYDVFYFIIDASTGAIKKGPVVLFNHTTDSERQPVVAYGGNYWLVAVVDRSTNSLNATFITKAGDPTYVYTWLGYGIVYDYRDPRIAYNPNINKFAVVAATNASSYNYDIALWLIDPGTFATVQQINITNDATDDYRYASQGAVLTYYGNGFIVFWADQYANVKFANVTVAGDKYIGSVATAGSNGIYPDITTSDYGAVVVWKDASSYYSYVTGTIKVTIIKNNVANTYTATSAGYYPSIAMISNEEAVIVYGDGNGNVKAQRVNVSSGDIGLEFTLATNTTDTDVQYEKVEADVALEIGIYGYSVYDAYPLYWGSFARTDLPAPTLTSTEIVNVTITFNDTNSNGFIEPGDIVNVTGRLVETGTSTGIAGQHITVDLYYWIPYTNVTTSGVKKTVASVEVVTDTDGSFVAEITVPATIHTMIYGVYIEYPGNTTLNYGASSYDIPAEDAFMLFATAPSFPTWETVPTDLSDGPALYYANGQAIITDPAGDYANITPSGIPAAEASDLDLRLIQLALDDNYLYIRIEVAGNPGLDGNIAPIFMLAFDFTPDNPYDGGRAYYGNVPLYYPWDRYSETHLTGYRRWDLGVTLAPVHSTSQPVVDADKNTKGPLVYVLNRTGDEWFETAAGYMTYGTNYVEAAIPLDLVRWYNPELPTTGVKSIMMYAAVFAENITTPTASYGYIIDRDAGSQMDVFDIAGGYPANFTGTHLEQGYIENYAGNALDTYFILNINFDTNKFYGYAAFELVNSTSMYVGTDTFTWRIFDANNTRFGVYGITPTITPNDTDISVVAGPTTTNATGHFTADIRAANNAWHKTITLALSASSTDYIIEARDYVFTVKLLINFTDGGATWKDSNNDGIINAGDQLYMWVHVKARDENNNWVDWAGINVSFVVKSTPYTLGTALTNSSGIADLLYVVTGDEEVIGTHELYAVRSGDTYALNPGGQLLLLGPHLYVMSPAPEPPVMPLLLLAALLLFIIIKKRK